ncbi:MAG: type 2 isopentenyl-diphosphate Delta-isomerase [Ignavibacteriae bacterium HGW-Ignavibacteriae-3]|nr:MAG: type 2 isopentenyl-diphosphate Delta-isomerase [Ignavibacteriae bacterium HGW-Ignavibacteriae-3]
MPESKTSERKKDHIELCLQDKVSYKIKTNGFENYDFEHYAATEVEFDKIDLSTEIFGRKISLPFMISCMTGGTSEAKKINEKLALAANILNIPIGVGSQRQALESKKHYSSYRAVINNAGKVPVLGNIGAAQVAMSKNPADQIKLLIDLIEADAMVVHLNPLQELLQNEGEPDFNGLLKNLEIICKNSPVPVIAKEVGSGISKKAAKKLLDAGVKGIDVAGTGGTSWAAVELIRSGQTDTFFSEWGLPTSYCVRTVNELKSKNKFTLIASGGINNGVDVAKSLALGADLSASARIILLELMNNGSEGVVSLIKSWFLTVKKIMYLTGCNNINKLKKIELIRKGELF